MKIFLIGYMGSGKSTIGVELSTQLGFSFLDTDQIIEKEQAKSISKIFEEKGESYFRSLERACLESLLNTPRNCIVATGGGLPCFNNNIERINEEAISIYLKVSIKEIYIRVSKEKTRPLVVNKLPKELKRFIRQSLAHRRKYYGEATIKIRATGEPSRITERIIKKLKPFL